MSDFRGVSTPWQVSRAEFEQTASEVEGDGAVCVFVVDEQIPLQARSGYATLVIAYARSDEPVHILDDGTAALLIRQGGTDSATVAGRRVIDQMRKLGLDTTLRAGVAALRGDAANAIEQARGVAASNAAGAVHVAA
ncbi:MAG: hypothetical protein JOY68_08115 [Candidatus Dormibacteraeota bacterium]|nr:hypothetical protein [Candidatus Dormibacteraeota bacterium]